MSNKRINEHSIDAKVKTIWDETGSKDFPPMNRHLAYGLVIQELIAELKRCYEEIDALRSIAQDWVKIETFTDDGKDLSVDMEDSDGNCFSGYINRASE